MWMIELTMKTMTADSRIGSQSEAMETIATSVYCGTSIPIYTQCENPLEVVFRKTAASLRWFTAVGLRRLPALASRIGAFDEPIDVVSIYGFTDEFQRTLRAQAKFVEISNHHVPVLMRKARRIDDYLSQK